MAIVRTQGLTKSYGAFTAVDHLNLSVRRGEIYGFLGPNGAGKTTTILMLVGTVPPTSGQVFLLDRPFRQDDPELRRHLGVISENQYLYDDMTAFEYLTFFAKLYQVPNAAARIKDLLNVVGLWDNRHNLCRRYSRGMQQKLGIARAILHDPEVLIWDEPVSGLDALAIRQVRDIILDLRRQGKTIIISSHILSEIEKTADRVGILFKGRLVAEDSVEHLRQTLGGETSITIEVDDARPELVKSLTALDGVRDIQIDGQTLDIAVDARKDYRGIISSTVFKHGRQIFGMRLKEMTLEEMFVTLTEKNVAQLLATSGRNR